MTTTDELVQRLADAETFREVCEAKQAAVDYVAGLENLSEKENNRLHCCPTHGQQPANAWGCPECVRELREELACAREIRSLVAAPTDDLIEELCETFNCDSYAHAAVRRALELWGVQPNPLAQQALEVLEALAEIANDGEPGQPALTIVSNWEFGSATLIAPDGSHAHVGGDTGETREENMALFIEGLHQQLVQRRGAVVGGADCHATGVTG